jgi:hypothetical protein
MRAQFINEEFKEKSDPIEDMGIGVYPKKIYELRKELKRMFDENYDIISEDVEGRSSEDAWNRIDVIQEVQDMLDKLFGKEK